MTALSAVRRPLLNFGTLVGVMQRLWANRLVRLLPRFFPRHLTRTLSGQCGFPLIRLRYLSQRHLSGASSEVPEKPTVSTSLYNRASNETLEALCEYLEQVGDTIDFPGYDCEYANGVLTVRIGAKGTYVINRQPPNKQIWLSSPLSGPKRYDLDLKTGQWVYEREGDARFRTLHELLNFELSNLLDLPVSTPIPRPPDEAS